MHKALHTIDYIDRLYVSRKEGRRGLTSIEDCIDGTIQELEEYTKKSKEKLITTANNSDINRNNLRINRKTTKISRKQKWEEKQLYAYFK